MLTCCSPFAIWVKDGGMRARCRYLRVDQRGSHAKEHQRGKNRVPHREQRDASCWTGGSGLARICCSGSSSGFCNGYQHAPESAVQQSKVIFVNFSFAVRTNPVSETTLN